MPGQPTHVDELLRRRLMLVAQVSALNAEALKLTQALAGAEMEALRCELAIRRCEGGEQPGEDGEQLVRELLEAKESAASIAAQQTDCEERIAGTEEELRAVDLLIAASQKD